jgi:hypothetical protein
LNPRRTDITSTRANGNRRPTLRELLFRIVASYSAAAAVLVALVGFGGTAVVAYLGAVTALAVVSTIGARLGKRGGSWPRQTLFRYDLLFVAAGLTLAVVSWLAEAFPAEWLALVASLVLPAIVLCLYAPDLRTYEGERAGPGRTTRRQESAASVLLLIVGCSLILGAAGLSQEGAGFLGHVSRVLPVLGLGLVASAGAHAWAALTFGAQRPIR